MSMPQTRAEVTSFCFAIDQWNAKTVEAELRKRGLEVTMQFELPVMYDEIRIDLGYRVDLLVEGSVVVELKTVSKLLPVHEAQLLSYLKLGDFRAGLLINFHAGRLKDGIKRMVNLLPELSETSP